METSEPAIDENATRVNTLEALRAALMAENGESHEGEADESQQNAEPKTGEPEGNKPKGKPKALKDLAERLELTPEDLYAIEVPMADGKSMTIGKLKDAVAQQENLELRELQFAERVNQQEAEWTRAQQEMQELLAQLGPKAVTPELQERVRQKVQANLERERALILQHIPEWKDGTVRDAELGVMVEYLKDFGIHESFLTTTMSHKLFRMVRHAALQNQRIKKALATVETVRKPSTTGKAKAGNGAPRNPVKTSKTPFTRGSDLRAQLADTLRKAG